MHILHMSLHGALMLEGSSTLMLTGQKYILVEGPSVLSYHGEGPITHLMPRCESFTCCCMVLWCCPHWCWQDRRMFWWRDLLCSAAMARALLLTWCPDAHPSHVAAWCSDVWRLARTDVDRAEECPGGGPFCACIARLGLETGRNTCQSGLQIRPHGWKFRLNSKSLRG
jgi:hypothetical protein